jgi:DNA-binding NarL/FixJ family response regulator
MQQAAKILIVDDHPVVRAGLAAALSRDAAFSICGEAESIQAAMRQVAEHSPDLVLADLDLEDGSGLDLIKKIRESSPRVRVLVLSMHDENLYAERALRAGACGYVMKDQPPESLMASIRSVMEGKIAVSDRISARVLQQFAGRQDEGGSQLEVLTDRELEVFRMLGKGDGTRRIADKLTVSVKTIEAHIAHIKRKLHISSGTELQHRAFVLGNSGTAGKGGPENLQTD